MTTRRTLLGAVPALMASFASVKAALGQAVRESSPKTADFLFVQTAKGMTFDKSTGKLTLDGVSPVTVAFSDRPERIAANMKTADFAPFWNKGKNSFLSDPPNADISLLEGKPPPDRRGAAGPGAPRRQPDLHGEGAGRRDAGHGNRRVGFH
jgi:hypothetical protein